MLKDTMNKILELSIKMRILRARIVGDNDTRELNDRQVLILELVALRKRVSVTELCQHFNMVGNTTISTDLKLFRSKKWTQKKFSPKDERIHLIELTEEGKQKMKEIEEGRSRIYLPLAKAIGTTNTQEIEVLNKIITNANAELDRELAIPKKSD